MPGTVKITSNGLWKDTHVLVDGQELPVTKIVIEMDGYNGWPKVTLETHADLIDIEALQKDTRLEIEQP